jgi:hypothetical protein
MAALDRHLRRGERALQSIDDGTAKLCGAFKSCCETIRNRSKPSSDTAPGDADPAATVPPGALS